MQNINEFMKGLLDEKGISVAPEIEKDLIADMKKQLEDQIKQIAILSLSEEKAKELADLIDKPDFTNEKMTEFMQNSGVDFAKIEKDAKEKFRELYLGEEAKND